MSKIGERFFWAIQAEIDRDPSVKHAIITNSTITKLLTDIAERQNVCFLTSFKKIDDADFEVAGGLDKLPEVIATRERFETERDNLTAESKREEVERILGCPARQANRVLHSLRGGNLPRFQEQILSLLADGEKKAAELVDAIDGNPRSISNELRKLTNAGEIVRVRRGVYALSEK